jgi:hypothetical protein
MVGQLQWELIEPLDNESIYARFLAEKDGGVHHIAVATPSFDKTLAILTKPGNSVVLNGTFKGVRCAYLDMKKDLGVLLEISDLTDPDPKPGTPSGRLRVGRRNVRDGSNRAVHRTRHQRRQRVDSRLPCPVCSAMVEVLARPKRFELLTPRFVVWCSIQLSYGRLCASRGRCSEHASGSRERGHNYRLRPGKARQVPIIENQVGSSPSQRVEGARVNGPLARPKASPSGLRPDRRAGGQRSAGRSGLPDPAAAMGAHRGRSSVARPTPPGAAAVSSSAPPRRIIDERR